jgi:hypothetical protein
LELEFLKQKLDSAQCSVADLTEENGVLGAQLDDVSVQLDQVCIFAVCCLSGIYCYYNNIFYYLLMAARYCGLCYLQLFILFIGVIYQYCLLILVLFY